MTLLLAALAASATPLATPAQDTLTRYYDLRAALSAGATATPQIDIRPHLTAAWVDALRPDDRMDVDLGPDHTIDADDFLRAIRSAVETEGGTLETVAAEAGFARVVGDASAQRAAALAVQSLNAALADRVTVEVHRVDDDGLPANVTSVLGRDAARSLVSGLNAARTTRGSAVLGRTTALGDEEVRTFLFDYDVEVASGSVAADPVISALHTGLELGVRVDRAVDGRRFVVRVWGRDGSVRTPMRTVAIDGLGGAKIELPRVSTSTWTASAIVEAGGALVVDHDGGGRSALVVRVAPEGASEGPASFFPLGELALRSMRPEPVAVAIAAPSGGWRPDEEGFNSGTAPWVYGETLSDFLEDALEPALDGSSALRLGSGLVLPRPNALSPRALEDLAGLIEAAALETVRVEVRYDFLSKVAARDVLTEQGLAAFAASDGPRLVGSAIENDVLVLVGGEEIAVLKDHDVQIAGGSTIPDPIVDLTFEGLALWCAPVRSPSGALTAWFDVQAHARVPEARSMEAVQFRPNVDRSNGPQPIAAGTFRRDLSVELPATRRVHARTSIRATAGEWSLVALRPVPGSERSLVVCARMTTR